MNFFSNAVKLIKRKTSILHSDIISDNIELDFSPRNYVKESFSIMIIRPISNYLMKFMRVFSFLTIGSLVGIFISIILLCIFMQFGSVENKFISLLIDKHITNLFPDADFSTKSSNISWNTEMNSPEINIKKLKIDDIIIPSISIFPNIWESIKTQKLITNGISIINPKINVKLSDDFNTIHFDPNFEKANTKKSLYEPLSLLQGINNLLNNTINVKILNADVNIEENGIIWNLKNLYCHYTGGTKFPRAVSFKIKFPGQEYFANFNIIRASIGNSDKYVVNLDACNPICIGEALSKRNVPINNHIITSILQNNLPISGVIHLNFKNNTIIDGDFDLIGGSGSIKLPVKNILSPNIGKAINNGSISGTFSEEGIYINSLNLNYDKSDIQLTGISIPMIEYNMLNVANINGTLSLSNINISEMSSLLPENFSKSIAPSFKNYIPGFKLDLFKVDLKGSMSFEKKNIEDPMVVSNGIFKISDAQMDLNGSIVKNIEATGAICNDGFDIKLSKAKLNDTIINSGDFFISNKDNSWIGNINADVAISDVKKYVADISTKLNQLPIEKLNIANSANINMKLVKISGDNLEQKSLPFRIVEGNGILKSSDNSKEMKFSWNDSELVLCGDIYEGKDNIFLSMEENLKNNSGTAEFHFKSNSSFLKAMIPNIDKICLGDYSMTLASRWNPNETNYDVNVNLKDALLNLPILGDMKLKSAEGNLSANILIKDNIWDISNISLDTADNKISGHIIIDNNGYLHKCIFNDFVTNDTSAKINILRDDLQQLSVSIIGEKLNSNILLNLFKAVLNNEIISGYMNISELTLADAYLIKNVKGSFDIKNGKLIKGGCYGVIGDNTTLALLAQPQLKQNESIISLSASDAGYFLKFFKISNSVNGGTINIVAKNNLISEQAMSGAFEITDFIAKNDNLTRLISFSSMKGINDTTNYSVGFNTCLGSFILSDKIITIENGKAIGPAVGISYNGTYDRLSDQFRISGISVLSSATLNANKLNGVCSTISSNRFF